MIKLTTIFTLLLLLTGCVTVPQVIRTPIIGPDITAVKKSTDQLLGTRVRWGGAIVEVSVETGKTRLQLVSRQLFRNGRPIQANTSAGRFMVWVDSELDPTQFRYGRQVTVVGTLAENFNGLVGEHAYRFAVIRAQTIHLWETVDHYPGFDDYPYDTYPGYYPYDDHFFHPLYHPFRDPFWPYRHYRHRY